MCLSDPLHPRSGRAAALLLAGALALSGGAAAAQPTLEARVRALEGRVAELEARVRGQMMTGQAAAAAAPDCESLHFGFNSSERVTVTANGRTLGVYDTSASEIITDRLRPGPNTLVFAFSGPAGQMQLTCTPPGGGQDFAMLRFAPAPGRLEQRLTVTMAPRR